MDDKDKVFSSLKKDLIKISLMRTLLKCKDSSDDPNHLVGSKWNKERASFMLFTDFIMKK
jgi:hypothetical protein